MSRVVVDTDVVSFLLKHDSRAEQYRSHLVDNELIISFMTLAELHRWALVRHWGKRGTAQLEAHLRRFAIHPFDAALCRTWAQVSHGARERGRPIGVADAWIAATAVLHGIPLVSHNGSHYAGVPGLQVLTA